MANANIDFVGKTQSGLSASGLVASEMAGHGLNVNRLRPYIDKDGKPCIAVHVGDKKYKKIGVNAATLRKDEWQQLDAAIIPVVEHRLNGIQDLISRNLVYNLGGNGLGTTVLESHTISDAMEAELTMDGVHRGKGDRQLFGTTYLPLPIIHVDYDINRRVLEASRRLGNSLDTTQAERAARRVAEKLESMLFADEQYSFGGGTIYSYVNYPNRNKLTMDTAWDDSSMTGKQIVDDILRAKQAMLDAHFYGPWTIYISPNYETLLDEDYNDYRSGTIRERILNIAGVESIKVVDTLADDNVIMVQMSSDVVRLVRGMGITNVQWDAEAMMTTHFKVMTIQVPQIRSDYNGATGIVHLATA